MRPLRLCRSSFYHSATHTATHYNTLTRLFATILYEITSTLPVFFTTLQHTVMHCNTLQHTGLAICYNTLCDHFNSASIFFLKHCNALQHNALQRTATQCNTLQHTALHCNTHAQLFATILYATRSTLVFF